MIRKRKESALRLWVVLREFSCVEKFYNFGFCRMNERRVQSSIFQSRPSLSPDDRHFFLTVMRKVRRKDSENPSCHPTKLHHRAAKVLYNGRPRFMHSIASLKKKKKRNEM